MDKMTSWFSDIAGVLFFLLVVGGFIFFAFIHEPPPKPKPLKYTIWVGDVVFATGHHTDEWYQEDDWVIWVDRDGNVRRTPITSIKEIEEN